MDPFFPFLLFPGVGVGGPGGAQGCGGAGPESSRTHHDAWKLFGTATSPSTKHIQVMMAGLTTSPVQEITT